MLSPGGRRASIADSLAAAIIQHRIRTDEYPLKLTGGVFLVAAFVGDLADADGLHCHLITSGHLHGIGQRGLVERGLRHCGRRPAANSAAATADKSNTGDLRDMTGLLGSVFSELQIAGLAPHSCRRGGSCLHYARDQRMDAAIEG